MGHLCNAADVMVLRHHRQKHFAKIQPQFNIKYGSNYPTDTLWYSYDDDFANGIYLNAYNVGRTTATNCSIASPSDEVFHLQGFSTNPQVTYTYDAPYVNQSGEWTYYNGVRLMFSYNLESRYTRDKPWLKYGISWDCYGTVVQYEQTLLYYESFPYEPVYSAPNAVATTPYYWFNKIEPQQQQGPNGTYVSNSIYVPASSVQLPPEPPEGGWPEPITVYPVGTKRTYYLGSISVGNITTYRRDDYHHA